MHNLGLSENLSTPTEPNSKQVLILSYLQIVNNLFSQTIYRFKFKYIFDTELTYTI